MSDKFDNGKGLTGNYQQGSENWGDSMNKNLEILNREDAIVLIDILGETPLPVDPKERDTYAFGHEGKIARYIDGGWVATDAVKGFVYLNQKDGFIYRWNDTGVLGFWEHSTPDGEIPEVHFLSVQHQSGDAQTPNYNNDGAMGINSMALGKGVKIGAERSIGIGSFVDVPAKVGDDGPVIQNVVVIGLDVADTSVSGNNLVFIGSSPVALAESSISFGRGVTAGVPAMENFGNTGLITIGNNVVNGAPGGILIGSNSSTAAPQSIGLGNGIELTSSSSIGIGNAVTTSGSEMIAIGEEASVGQGQGSIGIGVAILVQGSNTTAVGGESYVNGSNVVSMGSRQRLEASLSVVIGDNLKFGGEMIVNCAIVDPAQAGDDVGRSKTLSKVVRFGVGNGTVTVEGITGGHHAQTAIGQDNKLAGAFVSAFGGANQIAGFHSTALGYENESTVFYTAFIGSQNSSNPTRSDVPVSRHFAHGAENKLGGTFTWIGGVRNTMNAETTHGTTYVKVLGSENNLSGQSHYLSVLGDNNVVIGSTDPEVTSNGGVIIGHSNAITLAKNGQTIIGNRVMSGANAVDAIVIGNDTTNVIHEKVVYLGHDVKVAFNKPSKDATLDQQYAFSYLFSNPAYKVTEDGARAFFTGNNVLALSDNTLITNVAAGSDDDHAVNVKQLKKLASILNSDMSLFVKANKYACYLPQTEAVVQDTVVWKATVAGSAVETLTTVAEKQAFITTHFDVIETLVAGTQLLALKGTLPIKLEYVQTVNSLVMEVVNSKAVLNGGYSELHGEAFTDATPIHSPHTGWSLNPSLHQTTNAVFFVVPKSSNVGWGN